MLIHRLLFFFAEVELTEAMAVVIWHQSSGWRQRERVFGNESIDKSSQLDHHKRESKQSQNPAITAGRCKPFFKFLKKVLFDQQQAHQCHSQLHDNRRMFSCLHRPRDWRALAGVIKTMGCCRARWCCNSEGRCNCYYSYSRCYCT